jgi:hypothetical protein
MLTNPLLRKIASPEFSCSLLIIGLLLTITPATGAQEKPAGGVPPLPTPVPIKVKGAQAYSDPRNEAGMGDWIAVEVDQLSEAIEKDKINPRDLVLYLNGRALKGVNALPIEDASGKNLSFQLKRTEDSREAWSTLLGRPSLRSNLREVTVSVGFPDKQALPFSDSNQTRRINLRVYHGWWAVGAFIALLVVMVVFVRLAKRGYLIRDSNPPNPPAGKLKPYSLALTQAAWWFFLVIGSFLLIYLITGDYNTITDQALILMGIGTGTALGAAMIDATKRDTADTELTGLRPERAKLEAEVKELLATEAELKRNIATAGAKATSEDQLALRDTSVAVQEKQAKLDETIKKIDEAEAGLSKPVSEGLRKDLLTDVNGVTLHRFQMVVWTIVLGVLFCIGVYKDLAMPEFSGTLLALMGISSGTYLGFKIPERQN